jgi:tetratricopeptide (TPR) repeat protein
LWAASIAAFAVPGILIVQARHPGKAAADASEPSPDIATFIGQEYDNNGRLKPIVYSKFDPIFKAAIASGRLKNAPDVPQLRDAFEVAGRLGADYVLIIEASRVKDSMVAKVELFRDRRPFWKDNLNMAVSIKEALNSGDTERSIARTIVLRMNAQPFKGLSDHPKEAAPVLQPGQEPITARMDMGVKGGMTDAQLKASVETLVRTNQTQGAILLMRDAVDAAPLNLDRRMQLIDLLQSESPMAAAEEARRAAILMPERVELRIQAARAWIKAGQSSEAQKDLNEAVARDPNGTPTRLLLGELSLQQLQPAKALGHLDEVIKLQDSAQARFLRALCRSLLGGVDGMQIDLAQSDKLEPVKTPSDLHRRYALTADIMDRELASDGSDARSLLTQIVVKPKDQGLRDQIEQTLRLVQARTAFLTAIAVPPDAKAANDRRILAHKLLTQSLADLQSYSNTPDDDTLIDARINLGEALKQLAAVRG